MLLENWGRWSRGDDDPAMVYYYRVSPMFRDAPFLKSDPTPLIDDRLGELGERAMLRMRKVHPRHFRLLRDRHAYARTWQSLEGKYKRSSRTLRRWYEDAAGYFFGAVLEILGRD